MGSEEQKERGRIKRRNMIAKNMMENRRQYSERRIKDKKKEVPKFNKHKTMKGDYYDEASYEGYPCINPDGCTWPDCGCE